jgi:hypothetical protein
MGVYIALADQEGQDLFGRNMINKYYDFLAEKEKRIAYPTEESFAEAMRNRRLEVIEEDGDTGIWWELTSTISPVMDAQLPDHGEIWYDKEKIHELRDDFKRVKKVLQQRDPEANYEGLELKHIALCEFALENDLGVTIA